MKKGFSLIELIIVLSLIALLSTFSIYRLSKFIDQQALLNANSDLTSSLYFAQHYSQASGYTTVICASVNLQSCDSNLYWHQGWIVYQDSNGNLQTDSEEPVLLVKQPHNDGLTIKLDAPDNGKKIIFYPNGRLWPNSSFNLCHEKLISGHKLILINSGRIRSEITKDKPC